MLWFIYSLLSGFFIATADALSKKLDMIDASVIAWARTAFTLPLAVIALAFASVPVLTVDFWLPFFLLVPLDALALFLYLRMIKIAPISLTMPFLSLTPMFLLFTSWLLLGEFPTTLGLLGIMLIVVGAYVMNLDKRSGGVFGPFLAMFREKGILVAIILAFIFSINANLVKIAIMNSEPLFFMFLYSFALFFVFSLLFWKKILKQKKLIVSNAKILSVAGICHGLMFLFHFLAALLVIVPYMISIKRSSSLFGVLYGHFWFKEKNIKQRFIGAFVMLVGAGVILLLG